MEITGARRAQIRSKITNLDNSRGLLRMDFLFKNKRRIAFLIPFIVLTFVLTSKIASGSDKQEAREYHLKAAFLRYVAKFVEWPDEMFEDSDALNICVLGNLPYFKAIDTISGKVVNEHELKVLKIPDIQSAEQQNCHLLFVTKTEEDNVEQIIKATQNKPILSFGDMDEFAEKGGDMNFYIMNNRLAIMINPPTIESSNLKISPRMLRLVTIVPPSDEV